MMLLSVAMPARAQRCAEDAALAHAAAELLAGDHRPSATEVTEAARAAGSDAPLVEAVLLSEATRERRIRALDRRSERFGTPLACGEAHSDGRVLLLIAPRAGRLEIAEEGVTAHLAEGWRSPRLYARDAEGTMWQSAVRAGTRLAIPEELSRPVTLQLVAEGPGGPRPVAERVVGGRLGGTDAVIPDSDEPIATRLDRLRAASDAGELRPNRLLQDVADQHARRVCAEGTVGHVTDEGDPERRLAREGIRARHVGETVARAPGASRAYAAMLGSPSHRSALIDRRFTDVGIGEARDGDATCLVVLLAAWPRAVPWRGE